MLIYTVRAGDTLQEIAARFSVPLQEIVSINGIADPARLAVGQAIILPTESYAYTVAYGDTLSTIANRVGETLSTLYTDNPSLRDRPLQAGEVVYIRGKAPKMGRISTVGYAYPNIDIDILERTLPHLTYLTIFSYGLRADGTLVPIEDEPLIAAAREAGTAPIMLLSTLGDDGRFNSEIAAALLQDEIKQQLVINELVTLLPQKGYYGIDVDFEFIPENLGSAYAAFITRLQEALSPIGKKVFVSLAPKTSALQRGILYEAHDYALQGRAADYLFVMTYEWGYTYSPPMAIAPIGEVRKVLQYAVTAIPPEKLFMGIPNYAYNWRLPFEKGMAAQSLGNEEAQNLAAEKGAVIQYDAAAASPFFTYTDMGQKREVWFEDARSISAKLRLAAEFKLHGIGVWNIMRWFGALWYLVENTFDIRKIDNL